MNFKTAISLLFIITISCNKVDVDAIHNLNGDFIYIIGHGGVGFQTLNTQLPENSMLSITKAISVYGADGVEVDVQLTKDLNPVLFHDDVLEASTGCLGYIYENNLSEIIQCKYNRDVYANLFIDEHIATLEAVLQKLSEQKIKPQLHLDLRSWLYDKSVHSAAEYFSIYSNKIVSLLEQYNYVGYTYIAAGDIDLLKTLSSLNSQLNLMIETSNIYWAVEIIKNNGWYGVVTFSESITKQEVDYAHLNHVRVALFGVKTQPEITRAINKHPDFIITDNIVQTQQILY